MSLSWRQRLVQQPSLREIRHWPMIDIQQIKSELRPKFLRNRHIVAQVLAGQPMQHVAHAHQLSPGAVTQLMNRCLGGEAEQAPALTQGCLPYQRLVPGARRTPLPTLAEPRGNPQAFQALLAQLPALVPALDAMIIAKLNDDPKAQTLTPQAFHGEFKRVLVAAAWPTDIYPYTTASCAYESVRTYCRQRLKTLQAERLPSRAASSMPQTSVSCRALRQQQIDEQTIDLRSKILLQLNDELIPLSVGRVTLLVAIDSDTDCVLGYCLAPTRHPNQDDMLALLDNCVRPWQAMRLTNADFHYPAVPAFPCALGESMPISFGQVLLDNALIHMAHSVRDALLEQQQATLILGLPGQPQRRNWVEHAFSFINQRLSHRPASTTGSHPRDPKRESRKNAKQPPNITFRTLDEALSIVFASHNTTPQQRLGGATPMQLMEHHFREHFMRYVPDCLRNSWQPFLGRKVVTLHWYRHEHRFPHINFAEVRYGGEALLPVAASDRQIVIEYDRRDVRTVQAFRLSGAPLGTLYAPRSWQRFPHDLATRNAINREVRADRFQALDPLAAYLQHALAEADTETGALQVLRIFQMYSQGGIQPLTLDAQVSMPALTPVDSTSTLEPWSTRLAHHRE